MDLVETLAQGRSPLDREVQHECSNCHQRKSSAGQVTLPEWTGDLREGLEVPGTSVVEMATTPLERSG